MSISHSSAKPVLVLLGDTASVSHHAGALASLNHAGIDIEWVCGSASGAISAAIMAGNPPEQRVRRLQEFWELYQREPWVWSVSERASPWDFTAWVNLWWRGPRAIAVDAEAARRSLMRFVDFDLLNSGTVRMTTLATDVERGRRRIFDSLRGKIRLEHILASSLGAPNTVPISIDGRRYWNDDWLSITPLQFILDEDEFERRLVFVVDPWARERSVSDHPDWQRGRAREIANITRIAYDIQGVGNNISLGRILGEKRAPPLSADTTALRPGRIDIVHARSDTGEPPGANQLHDWDRNFASAYQTIARAVLAQPWKASGEEIPVAVHTTSGSEISTEVFPGRADDVGRGVPPPADLRDVFREASRPTLDTFNLRPVVTVGVIPKFEPAPPPRQKPSLIFKLEGDQARGNEAVWGTAFDLVVDYGTAMEGALAAVTGELLVSTVSGPSVELGMMLTPIGFILIDSNPFQRLKFENGRLGGEIPRFTLRAPQPIDVAAIADGPCGVWIVVTRARAPLHTFFLEIHLVETLQSEARPTHLIDFDIDDAALSEPEERSATLSITGQGESWLVYWDIGGVRSTPRLASSATPAKLKAAYDSFIVNDLTEVANSALWRNTDEQLQLPQDEPSVEAARQAMFATAGAGYKLYKLFAEDPIFREALDLIEQLPERSKITVFTDDVAFPWELFYPLSFTDGYPAENYKPEKFWGNRFIIESLLVSKLIAERLPSNRRQTGHLHISMGVNESIDQDPVWRGRKLLPVRFQKDYFDKYLSTRGDYAAGYRQILSALRKQPAVASLIYFFCHGSADKLEFEKSTSFTPYHVAGPDFPDWPVVFVNACEAGNISPLSFLSFRTEFRKRRSAGLIAPSFLIPTLFAAVFAKTFIERYVRQETVGSILLDLRRTLLRQSNPLGLWYSLQCPLDLRAPREE